MKKANAWINLRKTRLVVAMCFLQFSIGASGAERHCLPTPEMKAWLNDRGQYSMVAFESIGSNPKKYVVRLFYSTRDGSRGTEVVSEDDRDNTAPKDRHQVPKVLCRDGEYTNIQLANNNLRAIPKEFPEPSVEPDAARTICNQRKWAFCGIYNNRIAADAMGGRFPMLKLLSAEFDKQGKLKKTGAMITVSADLDGELPGVVELSAGGVSTILYLTRLTTYTKDGLLALNENWPLLKNSDLTPRQDAFASNSIQERNVQISKFRDNLVLEGQNININGKKVNVAATVKTLDNMLNDWDKTYEDMKKRGLAK